MIDVFGIERPDLISKKANKGEYRASAANRIPFGSKKRLDVFYRRGSAGRRLKTVLIEQLPSIVPAAAGVAGAAALRSKPNLAAASLIAGGVANYGLSARGNINAKNKQYASGDLKVVRRSDGKKIKSTGWSGPKFEK